MSNYRISRTVPLPKRKSYGSRFDGIPIERLSVGDSIKLCDLPSGTDENNLQSVHRVGILASARRRGICGNFRVGIHKTKFKKELRVWKTI